VSDFDLTTEEITKYIPKDGITVDGEKLSGVEDFIVDARRAKVGIRLLRNNQEFNNQIIELLTDKDNLRENNMETETLPCIFVSQEKLEETFSFNKLFYQHLIAENETWSDTFDGTAIVQSKPMYSIMCKTLYSGLDKFYTKIDGITGRRHIQNFTAMWYKLILDYYNTKTSSSATSLSRSMVSLFLEDTFVDLWVSAPSDIVDALYDIINYIMDGKTYFLSKLETLATEIYNLSSDITEFYFGEMEGSVANDQFPDTEMKQIRLISRFLASCIRYDEYYDIMVEYNAHNKEISDIFRISRLSAWMDGGYYEYTKKRIYVPFYNNRAIVYGVSDGNSSFFNILELKNINFCKSKQNNLQLQIGKIQKLTASENLDSGIDILRVDEENISLYSTEFIPVERYYKLEPSSDFPVFSTEEFKFYCDNANINSLMFDFSKNSYLYSCSFNDTNWMYFDTIKCYERVLLPSEDTFVDNIPVYDEESGGETDNYGLYIYRNFFDKYYVKNKSKIMDVYGKITLGNNKTYEGLVDFNSVKIDRNNISFELIDSIGVTIGNLQKLESFVEFSQFDIGGDGTIANTKAGTTLRQFANTMIRTPFPYNHELNNIAFDIGDNPGLENKLLSEVSAQDAFLTAIQCSHGLLLTNENGIPNIASDILTYGSVKTIDGDIINIATEQSISSETFNIEKLKNLAGYQKFTPAIVSFYMQLRNKYSVQKSIKIYNQETQINLLDRITYNENMYIVVNKKTDLRNRILELTLIGEK